MNWSYRLLSRLGRPLAALRPAVVALLAAGVLSCAAPNAFREGNALLEQGRIEEGLAKLEEAVRQQPDSVEYRIKLSSERLFAIQRLLGAADAMRREGKLTESEALYRRVQALEPHNALARQGLAALDVERRHRKMLAEAETLAKLDTGTVAALERVRAVLSENPEQREALKLKGRLEESRAARETPEVRLAEAYQKPITLEFKDAPIKSVLDVVSRVSGLNFFIDKDIRPDLKVTILAKDTSIADAVRLILVTNQLEQKILNENSILIYPNTPQKLKDYQTLSVRTFYLANADVKAVSNTIKTILKTQDLVVDERLGLIIMRDTPDVIRMAERIVALQDLSDPEVMLEVEVLEIKRSKLLELGIRWPEQATLTPLPMPPATGLTLSDMANLTPSRTGVTIDSLSLRARNEKQDGNILANPRIRVRNKDKAQVLIGDRVPVITTTSTSTGFVSESVSYVDVGLKLEVEPNIYLDEEVAIKVNLEVSSLVREVVSRSGTLSYQIGTRSANTVLRLKDGETQILAGLINDEERTTANKVPGLAELPILGRLFATRRDDNQRSEIVLSITPHLVRSIRRPDILAAEFESGTASAIGSGSLLMSAAGRETRSDAAAEAKPAAETVDNVVPVGAAPTIQTTAVAAQAQAGGPAGPVSFSWEVPNHVRAGEQFSAVLKMSSQVPISGLPFLISYDPRALQLVAVEEGTFFRQSGGQTNFTHRVDPLEGHVHASVVRQSVMGAGTGVNGAGAVVTVSFKAIKAGGPTDIQLMSVTPDPEPAVPVNVPVSATVQLNQ